jgi:hypothetical protein
MPTATVRLTGPDGNSHERAAIGTGPVDATFKAIDDVIGVRCDLLEYNVQAVTEGIDALGEVSVRSAKAYLAALNRLLALRSNELGQAHEEDGQDRQTETEPRYEPARSAV